MRILQRPENDEVKALRALVKFRHQGTCEECKTSFEADWMDLEGFKDPESYVHVHCPVCYLPQIVDAPSDILDYLRGIDISDPQEDEDDEE